MNEKILALLRRLVVKYEIKTGQAEKPVYMCTSPNTRNRYKQDSWKIPEDKPQCPIYNDNRCCGGCSLAPDCNHAVNCGCYGYTYAHLGGNDAGYFMHKASDYSEHGRLDKDGKFDWPYYKERTKHIYNWGI